MLRRAEKNAREKKQLKNIKKIDVFFKNIIEESTRRTVTTPPDEESSASQCCSNVTVPPEKVDISHKDVVDEKEEKEEEKEEKEEEKEKYGKDWSAEETKIKLTSLGPHQPKGPFPRGPISKRSFSAGIITK